MLSTFINGVSFSRGHPQLYILNIHSVSEYILADIKGFKSKAGKSFEAALVIDKEQKRVTFEFAARKA